MRSPSTKYTPVDSRSWISPPPPCARRTTSPSMSSTWMSSATSARSSTVSPSAPSSTSSHPLLSRSPLPRSPLPRPPLFGYFHSNDTLLSLRAHVNIIRCHFLRIDWQYTGHFMPETKKVGNFFGRITKLIYLC